MNKGTKKRKKRRTMFPVFDAVISGGRPIVEQYEVGDFNKWLGILKEEGQEIEIIVRPRLTDVDPSHLLKYYWSHIVGQIASAQGENGNYIHYDVLLPRHAPRIPKDLGGDRDYKTWSEMTHGERKVYCRDVVSAWNASDARQMLGLFLHDYLRVTFYGEQYTRNSHVREKEIFNQTA